MNPVVLEPGQLLPCPVITDSATIVAQYADLLGDESRLHAPGAEAVYLPQSVAQVCWAVRDVGGRGGSCVVSAGRTGIAGGAVPLKGESIVSLAAMCNALGFGRDGDEYYLRVEPGLTLASMTGLLHKKDFSRLAAPTAAERQAAEAALADADLRLWFPVNPTETSAQLGGIVATNASGSRSYRYGAARRWVRAITVVLADGGILAIRRGQVLAEHGKFLLTGRDGTLMTIPVGEVAQPATKATLGYPLHDGMDLIDLFIGSEGTLGLIVEIELRLARRPSSTIGVFALVPEEAQALQLVGTARACSDVQFDAIEYFDQAALSLLQDKKLAEGGASHLPELPSWDGCGVYFELSGSEEQTEQGCTVLEEVLDTVGLNIDSTWAAMTQAEMAAQRLFRHAVPEAVNAIISQRKVACPGLHKVGTDMAVPDDRLTEVVAMYRKDLAATGIGSVIFGHIGNNHLHVNLLPVDMAELECAKALYLRWASRVVAMGGAVAAEHGIGQMKKALLAVQYPDHILEAMRRVRRALDPGGLFGRSVLVDVRVEYE